MNRSSNLTEGCLGERHKYIINIRPACLLFISITFIFSQWFNIQYLTLTVQSRFNLSDSVVIEEVDY